MTALRDIKIADFSWVGAGPRATKDLADQGAVVVKVESRRRLDLGRRSPPFAGDPGDHDGSAFFAQTNTSKLSVSINLTEPEGQALAKKLVAWADVVVENFGPGYMERIGLGYEQLQAIKPDIILASVSVAGRSGPMAGFRGYGNSAAAHSGHAALSGWPGSEPHMPPFAYGDVVAPLFATLAILGALEERARTGRGQHLDISQIEPMVQVIADLYAQGADLDKPANDDPLMAPHNVYPTRGEDNWIAIAIAGDDQWRILCQTLDLGDWADDARFADAPGRCRHRRELDEQLAAATAGEDADDLARRLTSLGLAAAAVRDGRSLNEDEELLHSGHFVTLDHPVLGTCRMPAPPMKLAGTPAEVRRAPRLGEHNQAVFVDLLGLDAERVRDLEDAGVLV